MTVAGDGQAGAGSEPAPGGLGLTHEHGRSLRVTWEGAELARYVYRPWEPQPESPRPYLHPLRTLGGDLVSLYRPHDHVWHKGVAWSLPNVRAADGATQNFWGGTTYLRGREYVQLPNNGRVRHRAFDEVSLEAGEAGGPGRAVVAHRLDWVTQDGETWLQEARGLAVTAHPELGAWSLVFSTRLVNAAAVPLLLGSPTTEGRPNAGYGGLFWRGPRSFTGGQVLAPGLAGGDELMGGRHPWLGFTGRHDGHGRSSTLVFVDAPGNPGHPVQWFVRSTPFACVCPAPFFSAETSLAPGASLRLRYAVLVADGDAGPDRAARLAETGRAELA